MRYIVRASEQGRKSRYVPSLRDGHVIRKKTIPPGRFRLIVSIVLCLAVFTTGCSRGKTGGSGTSSGQASIGAPRTPEDSLAGDSPFQKMMKAVEENRAVMEPVQQPQQVASPPLRSLDGGAPINPGPMSDLVFTGIDKRYPPSDEVIGSLFDTLKSGQGFRDMHTVLEKFLTGLKNGKIADELILPTEKLDISRSLSYTLIEGTVVREYRIGEFHSIDDAEGYLKIRLLNDEYSTNGEIYVRETEAGWLISDIQIDLAALTGR